MRRPPALLSAALAAVLIASAATAEVIDLSGAEAYPAVYPPSVDPEGTRDVVLLGADLVEIAVALGEADRILARPDDVDLPGIADTPHRMREWAGVEGVLALGPALVVGSSVINTRLLDGLKAMGVRTDLVDRTLPPPEKVRRLAALLGVEGRGEELVAAMEADYAGITPVELDGRPLRIVHVSKQGAGTSFTAGGAETAVDNLIRRVGAVNAAAEIGRDRYRPVTPEGMVLMAPDVVLIADVELPAFGDLDGMWSAYPGLELTPAGRERRAIVMRDLHVRADAASSGIATRTLADALGEMFR